MLSPSNVFKKLDRFNRHQYLLQNSVPTHAAEASSADASAAVSFCECTDYEAWFSLAADDSAIDAFECTSCDGFGWIEYGGGNGDECSCQSLPDAPRLVSGIPGWRLEE